MNRHLRHSLYWLALAALLLGVMVMEGCSPQATMLRAQGFDAQWQGFRSLPSEPFGMHETEVRVRVVVVEKMDAMPIIGAAGTYSSNGTIHIIGKLIKGKIVTSPAVLGHEFQHALEYQDTGRMFVNPDRLEEYGY